MFKSYLKIAIVLSISMLVAALLGEAILRMTMKDRIILFPRYHTDATYGDFQIRRFRPDSVFWHTSVDGSWQFTTNDKGFRNEKNFPYEPAPGKLRILALGDSHTAGYEVAQNETYSAVLEELLLAGRIDAEVINSGISGFGTAEQLVFLENEGLKYKPDIVIVGFYANDFQDNVKSGLYKLEDNVLTLEKYEHLPGVKIQNRLYSFGLVRWLSENSYFYSFTFNAAYEIAKAALSAAAKEKAQTEYAIPVGDFTDYEYSLANALIGRIYELCRENGITLMVMDIPVPTRTNAIKTSIPDSLIESFRANSDVLIDSRSALAPLVQGEVLIHVPHGHQHISAESHRLLAQQLANEIIPTIGK